MPPQIIQQRQHYYDPHAASPSYTKMTTFQPIQQQVVSNNGSSVQANMPFNNNQLQQQQQHLQFYEKSSQLPMQVQNYSKNMSQAPQHQQRPSPPRHVNTWHHQHTAKIPYPSHVVDPNMAFINHEATG